MYVELEEMVNKLTKVACHITSHCRLHPQMFGFPAARPREYRCTWDGKKSKWLDSRFYDGDCWVFMIYNICFFWWCIYPGRSKDYILWNTSGLSKEKFTFQNLVDEHTFVFDTKLLCHQLPWRDKEGMWWFPADCTSTVPNLIHSSVVFFCYSRSTYIKPMPDDGGAQVNEDKPADLQGQISAKKDLWSESKCQGGPWEGGLKEGRTSYFGNKLILPLAPCL